MSCIAHIKLYTQSNILLRAVINCSLSTISSFVLGGSAAQITPGPSQPPTPPYLYKTVDLELTALCNSAKHYGRGGQPAALT